ncbi:MAG: preprotein translocase subunit SecE [Alphaproteobacteria bacterium]
MVVGIKKYRKIFSFLGEVKQEILKVKWGSRKETMLTATFVFIFALIAALYFVLVDQVIYRIIRWIIGG